MGTQRTQSADTECPEGQTDPGPRDAPLPQARDPRENIAHLVFSLRLCVGTQCPL